MICLGVDLGTSGLKVALLAERHGARHAQWRSLYPALKALPPAR